jgi:adenosylcobinamide-phosphate synthase
LEHIFFATGPGLSSLVLALILDTAFGDPERPTHPVVLMGSAISWGEKQFRSFVGLSPFMQGALMALTLTAFAALTAWGIEGAARLAGTPFFIAASGVMIFYGLALRTLCQEVASVAKAMEGGGLKAAREQIARLVSRDTTCLDEHQIASAAIETAAENLVDGVISPFFYAALGGPALMAAFKMISTMDSMIGYKSDRYIEFGKAAARMDDAANYLPARICPLFIAMAALILFGPRRAAAVIPAAIKEGSCHSSPNSGLPEAAFAAALGIRIGGPCLYFGKMIEGHWYNSSAPQAEIGDIKEAVRLVRLSALFFYGSVLSAGLIMLYAA